jgi:uncharacterized protein (DUF1800 family)
VCVIKIFQKRFVEQDEGESFYEIVTSKWYKNGENLTTLKIDTYRAPELWKEDYNNLSNSSESLEGTLSALS